MNSLEPSCSIPTTHPSTHTTTNVQRKPRITYKSPSGGDSYVIGSFSLTAVPQNYGTSSSTSQPITLKMSASPVQLNGSNKPVKRDKYPMGPPLPLYHPLGRLALSLPPLDPASVGLPTPIRSDGQDAARRSSARARRPVTKLRNVDDNPLVPSASTPVFEVEVKEKYSPRKRRVGGSKRRRREVDDGDATYPAKRTRVPRGAASQHFAGDEEALESIAAEVTPTPEPMSDLPDDGKLERRSTRSRASVKRRDSSASEAASSISAEVIGPAKEEELMEGEKVSDTSVSRHPANFRTDEKEEGELSEEGRPPHHDPESKPPLNP